MPILPLEKFQEFSSALKNAQSVFIASHENPDADAVASVLSLHLALKEKGLTSFPYLPDLPPKHLSFLPGFFDIENDPNLKNESDFVVCLDCGDFKRLRLGEFSEDRIITIDHHLEAGQRGFLKIIEPNFCSAAEIIYFLLQETKNSINRDIATCLLAGIISDSGGLQHFSTSSETFKVVADLVSKGVLLEKIMKLTLFMDKPPNILKIWGRALSRMQINRAKNFSYAWVTFQDLIECRTNASDLAGIPSVLAAIPEVDLSLFMVEYEKNKVKGSLRTECLSRGQKNKVDIVSIASALAGGGHPYASGFKQEGTIEEVLERVYKLIG